MTHTAVHERLQRLVHAAPLAWRQDRVFRMAAIGAGVTGALLLLRVVGSHDAALQPLTTQRVPAAVPTLPGADRPRALANGPKIAPGHALEDVRIVPAPSSDRFGTAPPPTRP